MSDIIREAIQRQINEDTGEGNLVTGWLLVASFLPRDAEANATAYGIIAEEHQPYHISLGLISYAERHFNDGSDDE